MAKWEIRYCYDVWGNAEDGWEVNDTMSIGTFDIADEVIENDKKLLEFLTKHEFLFKGDIYEVDGDYQCIEIRDRRTQYPLLHLFMQNQEVLTDCDWATKVLIEYIEEAEREPWRTKQIIDFYNVCKKKGMTIKVVKE